MVMIPVRLRESRRAALVGGGWEAGSERRPCVCKCIGSGGKEICDSREWMGSGKRAERSEKGVGGERGESEEERERSGQLKYTYYTAW